MNMNINMNMNMNMNAPSENSGAWVCDGWDNLGAMATAGGRVADWDWEGASGAGNSLFLPTRRCCSPEEDTKPHIVAATPPTPALRQYAAGAGLGFPGAGIHLNSGVFPSPLGHLAPTAFHGGLGGGFSDVSGFGGGGGAFSGEPSSSRSQFLGSHGIHELVVKQEEMCAGDFHAAARIGLNLGHRTYFSSEDHGMGRIYRRPRALPPASQVPRCQAEGCKADLSNAKHYHRRHKVCEFHSKATSVIAGGVQQRFCQQCSRFHVLAEFDEVKRSCRKRLADHNRRRRKPHPTSSTSAAAAGSVPPPPQASSSSNSATAANKPENDDRSSGAAPANCSSASSARGLQSCSASARTEAQPVMNAIPLPLMSTNSSAAAGIGTQQKSAAARAVAATGPSLSLSSSSSGMSPSPCKALATAVTQQQDLSGLELALPWLRRSTSSDYGATASSRGHRQQSHRSFEILQQQQQQPLLSDKAATVESLNFLPLTTREWMLGSKDRNRHSQSQQMFSLMDSRTATDEDSAVQEHHQPQPVEYLSHHRLSSKRDMEQQHHGGKIPDGFRGFGSSIYDAASHL